MKRSLTDINATYRLPQPGELNERLRMRYRQDVPAPDGGRQPIYTEEFAVWGKVRQISGSAYKNNMQIDDGITHVIVIRKRSNISTDMEIIRQDGSIYRVVSVGNLNDGRCYIRINVKELRLDDIPCVASTFYGGYKRD